MMYISMLITTNTIQIFNAFASLPRKICIPLSRPFKYIDSVNAQNSANYLQTFPENDARNALLPSIDPPRKSTLIYEVVKTEMKATS